MEAEPRVFVLVKRRAVETRKTVHVGGEMRRNPVDEHADPRLMAAGDEAREVLRRAEARSRRIKADGLVAPRAVERKLAHRHELDMGEAHVAHIGNEPVGELGVAQETIVLPAHPRACMQLVDGDRGIDGMEPLTLGLPGADRGGALRQAVHDGGRGRRMLLLEGERVGLQRQQLLVRSE